MLKFKGGAFNPHPQAFAISKLVETLKKMPPDEVFDGRDIAKHANLSFNTIKDAGIVGLSELQPFTEKVGGKRYWGSAKAITELRRQVNA